MISKILNLI